MTGIIKVDKIQNNAGVSGLEFSSGGLLMPKSVVVQVRATDLDQSVPASTTTLVQWEDVEVDTCAGWDSTNHRYTPSVSGWYMYGGILRMVLSTVTYIELKVRKNGADSGNDSQIAQWQHSTNTIINGEYPLPTAMFYMNGTTDYIDMTLAVNKATTLHDHANRPSRFWAMLVHHS